MRRDKVAIVDLRRVENIMSDLEKVGSRSKGVNGSTDVEQSSFVTVDPAAERSYGEHVVHLNSTQITD